MGLKGAIKLRVSQIAVQQYVSKTFTKKGK